MGSFMSQQMKKILLVGPSGSGKTTVLYKFRLGDIYDPAINEVYDSNRVIQDAVSVGKDRRMLEMQALDDYYDDTPLTNIKQKYLRNADAIMLFIDSTDKQRLDDGTYNKYLNIISEASRIRAGMNGNGGNLHNSENKPSVTDCEIYSKYQSKKAIPLLILCNKQDLKDKVPYFASPKEIGIKLGLYQLIDYKQIFTSSKKLLSYGCSENVIDIIIDYIPDKDIVPINEKKAMFWIGECSATTGDGLYETMEEFTKIYNRAK